MIMVTHDQGLKYFAHRVVRMADGKVARIDTIAPESRKKIVDELEERCSQQHQRCAMCNSGYRQTAGCLAHHARSA